MGPPWAKTYSPDGLAAMALGLVRGLAQWLIPLTPRLK